MRLHSWLLNYIDYPLTIKSLAQDDLCGLTLFLCYLLITEINELTSKISKEINLALEYYIPCKKANCSCHKAVIDRDLATYKDGITKELFEHARSKGVKYQVCMHVYEICLLWLLYLFYAVI